MAPSLDKTKRFDNLNKYVEEINLNDNVNNGFIICVNMVCLTCVIFYDPAITNKENINQILLEYLMIEDLNSVSYLEVTFGDIHVF
jgi:hypothetical protein